MSQTEPQSPIENGVICEKHGRETAKWLVAYGIGGCWSGFPLATIVEADNKQDAFAQADLITRQEIKTHRGCSYDVEIIEGAVEMTGLYQSRLKETAKLTLKGTRT